MHHVHSTGTGAGTTFSTVRWCLFGSREHAPAHSHFTQSWAQRVANTESGHTERTPRHSVGPYRRTCASQTQSLATRAMPQSHSQCSFRRYWTVRRGEESDRTSRHALSTHRLNTDTRTRIKVSRPHCSAYGTLCTGCSTTTLTVEYVLELVYETSTRLLQLYSSRSQTDTSFIPSERSRFDGLPIDTPAPRARERGRSSQLAVLEPFGCVPFTARCPRAIWFRSVHSSLSSSQFVAFRVLDTSDRVAALGAGSSALDA